MELTCAYCGKAFTAKRHRECCSRSCGSRLALSRGGVAPWTDAAEQWLEVHADQMPFPDLCSGYNAAAADQGWPQRTAPSLRQKLWRLGLRSHCTEDNLNRSELARQLGITEPRVRWWIISGLPYSRPYPRRVSIAIADLKTFLLANPNMAGGLCQERLSFLIGPKATAKIMATNPAPPSKCRAVVCLGTGMVYQSLREAGAAYFVDSSAIYKAIRTGGTSAGLRWAYADQLSKKA